MNFIPTMKKRSTLKRDLPERNEVGVAEDWAEEGEQVLPHLCVSFHVPPPDLGQKTLEEGRKCPHHHRFITCVTSGHEIFSSVQMKYQNHSMHTMKRSKRRRTFRNVALYTAVCKVCIYM